MSLVKKQKSPQGWIETVPTAAATEEENVEEEEKVKRLEELTSSDKKIEQSIQVFNFSLFYNLLTLTLDSFFSKDLGLETFSETLGD